MHPGELLYEAILRAVPPVLRVAAPFHDKLRRGVAGRVDSLRSLRTWAAAARTEPSPLVWLHAPSVGEALMAQAILAALRLHRPDVRSMFTFFSPSAERVATRVGADWAGYLPWDQRPLIRDVLAAVRPTSVAFVRTEIWPVLGREAQRQGARVVLVNAVLAEQSSRLSAGARMLLGPAYARLDAVGAVTGADIPRLRSLGVRPDRIVVTGDARFDQVWTRLERLDLDQPLLGALRAWGGPRLVAGSTWPADEDALIRALVDARSHGAPWRLVIAPHEPAPAHVRALERRLDDAGISHARLPDMNSSDVAAHDALVVDRVGVLADLYSAGDLAYVGGGFGSAGLHSVVEPAALGVPVLFGPRHGHAREAQLLADHGGGFVVTDAGALAERLTTLHRDVEGRRHAGSLARAFVAAHVGGADRNARLILGAEPPV